MSNFEEKITNNAHITHLDNYYKNRQYGYQAVSNDKFGIHPVKKESKVFKSRQEALNWLKRNDTELRELEGLSKGRL